MALVCNIDSRGRALRRRIGFGLLLLAASLAFTWAHPFASGFGWVVTAVLGLCGVIALWEAHRGWCVARAAGFRVPF